MCRAQSKKPSPIDSDAPPKKVYRESFNWEKDMKVEKIDRKHLNGIYSGHAALNSRFASKGPQDKFM